MPAVTSHHSLAGAYSGGVHVCSNKLGGGRLQTGSLWVHHGPRQPSPGALGMQPCIQDAMIPEPLSPEHSDPYDKRGSVW